ncbi:MAG: hypothetical protein R3C59_12620 [Planctomycetaceae bacterium]
MKTTISEKLAWLLLVSAIFCGDLTADEAVTVPVLSADMGRLVQDLGSAEHAVRMAASAKLKELSADQIAELAAVAIAEPNAEVVVRIQAEIEYRYLSPDEKDVKVASDVLEESAEHQRLVLADQATQSLRQHWEKRVELAINELKEYGADVKEGEFVHAGMNRAFPMQQRSSNSFQILITEAWNGGDSGLDVFQRLGALCGPIPNTGGIRVFLLAGHPLTDEQKARLAQFVGNNRIQERSRVALGISGQPTPGQGVLILEVTEGSAAKEAGLEPNDLIIAIEDPNKTPEPGKKAAEPEDGKEGDDATEGDGNESDGNEGDDAEQGAVPKEDKTLLRDFDDLVERLMHYKPGDVMTMRVIRNYPTMRFLPRFGGPDQDRFHPQQLKVEVVKVKLKPWGSLTAR